jgi:transposase
LRLAGIKLSELRKSMHQDRDQGASYQRVEVITGTRRRRDWSDAEKARIVAESFSPDTSVSDVARRNGVSRGLLTVWRREALQAATGGSLFARVEVEDSSVGARPGEVAMVLAEPDEHAERIEIAVADATVRVPTGADVRTLTNVIMALRSAG